MNLYTTFSGNSICLKRFSIFKENILSEFEATTIRDVVLPFASMKYNICADIFGEMFGTYSSEYGQFITDAFESKIEELVAKEGK